MSGDFETLEINQPKITYLKPMSKLKILHENCKKELAQDKTLPYTAYLITYESGSGIQHDIALSTKQADIFDHYWDKYHSVLAMKQTEGNVNPKLWKDPTEKKKNPKKK